MKPVHKLAGAAFLAIALCAPALAFDLDSGDAIRVAADSARLDDVQGKASYQGNVEIRQGDILLTADQVEIFRNEKGLERIEARGQPATYARPATEEIGATHAEARQIHFSASNQRLRFEQDALVEQDGNQFRGAVIDYDTRNRIVTGEGLTENGEGSGRVEMIIQPRTTNDSN